MMKILSIHLFLSLILPINIHRSKSKIEYMFGVIVCLFFPVGGYLISILLNYGKVKTESLEEDDFEIKVMTDMFKKQNTDIVSIEDSLLFNEVKTKRRSIIDILKRDIDAYISKLMIGLQDDDTETAHYAASAIAEFTRKLDLDLQEIAFVYEQDKLSEKVGDEYYQVLNKYINSGILKGISKTQYMYTCIDLIKELINNGFKKNEYYIDLVELLIEVGERDTASEFVEKFFRLGETEAAYKLKLELLYDMRDFESFRTVFNQLLQSDLVFSRDTLSLVRFWKEVARYEDD